MACDAFTQCSNFCSNRVVAQYPENIKERLHELQHMQFLFLKPSFISSFTISHAPRISFASFPLVYCTTGTEHNDKQLDDVSVNKLTVDCSTFKPGACRCLLWAKHPLQRLLHRGTSGCFSRESNCNTAQHNLSGMRHDVPDLNNCAVEPSYVKGEIGMRLPNTKEKKNEQSNIALVPVAQLGMCSRILPQSRTLF